jgi:hypothetical protein
MSSQNTPAADSFDPAVDRRLLITGLAGVAGVAALASMAKAGPLTPPGGPVTSTPGPEPRIAVNAQNTPGNGTAIFVISQPGSYYLTGNVQGATGKYGIQITASNVTLDLNGFTVQGVPGALDGVVGVGVNNVTVYNGVCRGWGGAGVTLYGGSTNCVIRNVTSFNNASGLYVGGGGQVTDCIASSNSGFGISAEGEGLITGCLAISNTGAGIVGVAHCIISDCISSGNGRGVEVITGCTVTRCSVMSNVADGIRATLTNTITDNTLRSNVTGVRLIAGPSAGANRVERNTASFCGTSYAAESQFNFFAANTSAVISTAHWNMAAGNYIRAIVATGSPAFTSASGGTSIAGTVNDPYLNIALT